MMSLMSKTTLLFQLGKTIRWIFGKCFETPRTERLFQHQGQSQGARVKKKRPKRVRLGIYRIRATLKHLNRKSQKNNNNFIHSRMKDFKFFCLTAKTHKWSPNSSSEMIRKLHWRQKFQKKKWTEIWVENFTVYFSIFQQNFENHSLFFGYSRNSQENIFFAINKRHLHFQRNHFFNQISFSTK